MASQQMRDLIGAMMAQRAAGGPPTDPVEARVVFDATLAALPPHPGGWWEPVDAGGVAAEWTGDSSVTDPGGTLLYLHGGGYMQGSPGTHRRLVAALAGAAGFRALSVDYRLAPEHPFPAAVEDALTAYRWLIGPGGADPAKVVVAGDSAGGGLSLALLLSLVGGGDRSDVPAGAYLLSPWTDLAGTGASAVSRAAVDPMIDPAFVEGVARMYKPEGPLEDPLVSPLYADPGVLGGLPPLLIHVGDAEVLLDDSTRLAARAEAAGVEVELEVWPEAFHVFQMMVGLVPEADEAVARAGAWMAKRVAQG